MSVTNGEEMLQTKDERKQHNGKKSNNDIMHKSDVHAKEMKMLIAIRKVYSNKFMLRVIPLLQT